MLFKLSPNTPRFRIFELLNEELLHFIQHSIPNGVFRRELFTQGQVGQACWNNSKENNLRATKDLTFEKFMLFFREFQAMPMAKRTQLNQFAMVNQNLQNLFTTPQRNQLNFIPDSCFKAFKNLTTHLYCATKDLQPIIDAVGGVNIKNHFEAFRRGNVNGNICKACGLTELSEFRANIPDGDQWRADYDHLLCKSKYPLYAVHPDNLIPICSTCNQDAKKVKDLFVNDQNQPRLSFYPFIESADNYVDLEIEKLRDPEPEVRVTWITDDVDLLSKLDTWDDVYEIKNRVEGKFINLETVIIDLINPEDYHNFVHQVNNKARPPNPETYTRLAGAYWEHKLFNKLNQINLESIWEKIEFFLGQGQEGGNSILEN